MFNRLRPQSKVLKRSFILFSLKDIVLSTNSFVTLHRQFDIIMRKIEVVSLILVVAAVFVLVIMLQMDFGNSRKWMYLLFIALLALAIDPAHFLKKRRKQKAVESPAETEEDEMGFFELASAQPVGSKELDSSDSYMTFLDKESDDYYYIHYVNGKMDEAYVGGPYYVVREGYDELYEEYASLEGLSKTAENEEIEDLCSISAEDFKRVRTRYQDSLANDILARVSTPNQSEPVNRIGRGVAYVLVALVFVILLVGVSILPFMQVDGGTYIGIFIIFCLVLLIAGLSFFSPKTWLESRIKWLTGSVKQEVLDFGTGKAKWYYANDENNLLTYRYAPGKKQLLITKTIQVPLRNVSQNLAQKQQMLTDWIEDKPFIGHCDMSTTPSIGMCHFYFTIPKTDATKAVMRQLREWIFRPEHDASKVCEYFKFEEPEGTFYVKFQNCRIHKILFERKDGKTEVFDPETDSSEYESLSEELQRFYADFNGYYAPRIKEDQRIESHDWPSV